jgi:hypothetical protein
MGTAGSTLSGTGINFDDNDWKSPLMDKCIGSWFDRHKSTDAMKQGRVNEEFVVQRLMGEAYVHDVFEVGMLQSIDVG